MPEDPVSAITGRAGPDDDGQLRQLRAFVTAAETGSIGAAAGILGTAQPPLSRLLARLENRLNLTLFERHSRGVRLTAAGEALLPAARAALESLAAFDSTAALVAAGRAGVLRVGTTEGVSTLLTTVLQAFAERWPEVRVLLTPVHTPAKMAMLTARELDVAFVRKAKPAGGIRVVDVWKEPLVAVVASDHPLVGNGSASLAALAAYPLMVTPPEVNPTVHEAVMDLFERAGLRPVLGPPALTQADALTQIAASRQWTLLTPSAIAGTALPVTALPLEDAAAVAAVGLAWREFDARPLIRDFVATVQRVGVPPRLTR